jgi:hypothetical protein
VNEECCSFVDGALDVDRPIVGQDDALDDRETKPGAGATMVGSTGVEAFEDAR